MVYHRGYGVKDQAHTVDSEQEQATKEVGKGEATPWRNENWNHVRYNFDYIALLCVSLSLSFWPVEKAVSPRAKFKGRLTTERGSKRFLKRNAGGLSIKKQQA